MGWNSRFTLVAAAVTLFATVPLGAQTAYSVSVGEGGFNVGPCTAMDPNAITTGVSGSAPVSAAVTCGPNGGTIHSSGFSNQGQIGGAVSASESLGGPGGATSSFNTHVVFSKIGDPASQDLIGIALSFNILGQAAVVGSANGGWHATLSLGSNDYNFSTSIDTSVAPTHGANTLSFTSGGETFGAGTDIVSGTLTTPVLPGVGLNMPVLVKVALNTSGFGNPGTFTSSFALSCLVGVDVFTLPPGYTANDPDIFLVNNRCVPPAVYTWGSNNRGQLGNGTTADSSVPVQVVSPNGSGSLDGVIAVSGGGSHSLALTNTGAVYAWGDNSAGQLGVGSATASSSTPVQVSFGSGKPVAIAAGKNHSLALMDDGTVYSWGGNLNGQPGDGGSSANVFTPVLVMGPDGINPLKGIVAIAAGNQFSLALAHDNTVYAWGTNLRGELGNGSASDHVSLPAQVVGPGNSGTLGSVIGISASQSAGHSLAVTNTSLVYAWGEDQDGELGNGATGTFSSFPALVEGLNGSGFLGAINAVAAGGMHSLALSSSGNVDSFGYNLDNELGNGSTSGQSAPMSVLGPGGAGILGGISAIQGGGLHSLGIATTGVLYAWGAATNGQLGNGTTASGSGATPVEVLGLGGVGFLQSVSAVAGGGLHSLALVGAVPVSTAGTSTTIGAPAITYGADGSVTVTVTASSGQAVPTGSVSLAVDGGTPVSMPLSSVSGVSSAATFTLTKPAAGTSALAASYAGDTGFSASSATGSLTVNQASLTVTADNQQKLVGQANPALTFTPTGLVGGDTAATAFTTPPSCVTTAVPNSPVGTYPITCSGAVAPNYTVAYSPGVLTVNAAPDLTISKTHSGNFSQGQTGATYSIAVTNVGGAATAGTVTVVDALPAGLAATAMSGPGWTCSVATLTCTTAAVAPAAGGYPAITLTVNVASNAPASVTNIATVSGGGEVNTADDTASDPTMIGAGVPDLTVSKTHSGNFTAGQVGATYTITVTNVGTGPTVGTVTAGDIMPGALNPASMAGTGWNCNLVNAQAPFCTRSDALPPGSSYPAITLTVNVGAGVSASFTNIATVSGGGEVNTANDTASDPTTLAQVPDLFVLKTHLGNFTAGQTGATYTIQVNNLGNAPTTGTVTVIDALPAGLTATAMSGTGWNCTLANLTCTRSDALAAQGVYPTIALTVNVASNAPASVLNKVTVSGGGEVNTANDSYSDPTTIGAGVPDLTVSKTHSGNFTAGQVGATYTITVTNVGTGPTAGIVTASDIMPGALNPASMAGTGWSCNLVNAAAPFCTRSDALAAGSSYPAITLTVNVGVGTSASFTNIATVSGGGEVNTANDTASDPTTLAQVPDLVIISNHVGTFTAGQTGATYTIQVNNLGNAPTTGTVTVIDALPAGLTATAMSGTGWNCTLANLTCTRSDALAAQGVYPTIALTVNVASNAPASVLNKVTVSGGGEVNTANDSYSDPTTIGAGVPDLTVSKTHSGNFTAGQVGATYTITVTNVGTGPTAGIVTASDIMPGALNPASMAGTGWSCNLVNAAAPFCTRSDALAAGSSYPAITLTVNVGVGTSASFTNIATVSGGGEVNTANDTASDPTTLAQVPDLFVLKTHLGNFTAGQTGATYTIQVNNLGNAPTTGTVTVIDALPAGLTATAMSGTGWNCTLANLTCTRGDALAAQGVYPTIALTVNVASNAPASVLNKVTVSGGGEVNTANDSYSDPTTIGAGVPDLTVSKTHSGNLTSGQVGATYTITVTNVGTGPTVGTVTAGDVMPGALTALSMAGAGWNCNLANLTCTRSNTLGGGGSYPAIRVIVRVASNAPASLTNIATVSGGGEVNTANNEASDPSTIVPAPDLRIVATHVGNLSKGQQGAMYNIAVSNVGGAPTTGAVTVVDVLPASLSAVALSGSGWNCTLTTRSCTRHDALAPGSSYPAIVFTVNVAANAVSPLTNTAVLSDARDANLLNNISTDTVVLP